MRNRCLLVACVTSICWPVGQLRAQSQAPSDQEGAMSADELAEIQSSLAADLAGATNIPGTGDAARASPVNSAGGGSSMNPDIGFVLDTALSAFSRNDTLQTGVHDPQTSGFRLQQLEMSLGSNVDPYFRVDSNLVFSPEEGVDLEEAYATAVALPWSLSARVGQFLSRFGRIGSTHPHAWDWVDQPFVIGKFFGGEGNRQVGLEVSWLAPLPWYVEFVGSLQNATGANTARSFIGAAEGRSIHDPRDMQATGAVKQFFDLSDNWSLSWGLSVAAGPSGVTAGKRTAIWGSDVFLKYRPITRGSYTKLVFQAEYLLRQRDTDRGNLFDHGGYAYLLWQYAQRWESALRYEYGAAAKSGSGMHIEDPLDPEWVAARHRLSAATTFHPSEFSRLRWQASVDDPRWLDHKVYGAMFALEFLFGAHGTHPF